MSPKSVSPKPVSRRDFLKTGCLTVTAAGLTVCGAIEAIPIPDPSSLELPSSSYGEENMNNRILVAYASALGSTADVAVAIGEMLGANGFSVDVKPVQENPRVEGYRAALIGSAVRHGNWLPEAVDFVKANQPALGRLPVALFCVHITNLGNDEASRQNRLAFLNEVRPLLQPAAEVFFAGRLDRRGAALLLPGWIGRLMPPLDFRNWQKIRDWAGSVPALLLQAA